MRGVVLVAEEEGDDAGRRGGHEDLFLRGVRGRCLEVLDVALYRREVLPLDGAVAGRTVEEGRASCEAPHLELREVYRLTDVGPQHGPHGAAEAGEAVLYVG